MKKSRQPIGCDSATVTALLLLAPAVGAFAGWSSLPKQRNWKRLLAGWLAMVWFGWSLPAYGQWLTQTNNLKSGWNSVYLHVDASHTTLDELVGADETSPIEEIWLWRPALPTGQFITSPQEPTSTDSQWSSWKRVESSTSPLQRLVGNAAYLVRLPNDVAEYAWSVKGQPLVPSYRWTLTGLNFVGFPTPPTAPPSFEAFLAPVPDLLPGLEIYNYHNGNPHLLNAYSTTPVLRDQAYWMRAGNSYNEYFGPFQIVSAGPTGIRFGDSLGQTWVRLRNIAPGALTVTLRQIASETPPAGQPAIRGAAPMLLRGAINTTNLTYSYTNLANGAQQWQLAPVGAPGSEVEIVIGLDRSQMSGSAGDLYAAILRFTDSLNLSEVDVPVSGQVASTAGLWVGSAAVDQVSHYLKSYARATNELDFTNLLARLQLGEGVNGYHYEWDPATQRVLVFGGAENKTGSYLLDGPIRVDSGTVARPFPLRLIIHNDGANSVLLQRAYQGIGLASNAVVTTREDLLLASEMESTRRISAVHLPTSTSNTPMNLAGEMRVGGSLTTTVNLAFNDQASSPFLHTYHPDHDNLDATFTAEQSLGVESYEVSRRMTLAFTPPGDDFDGLTGGGLTVWGNYAETVTFHARGNHSQDFNVLGTFVLKRVSDIAALTTE
ncbi:MAG: hypothetical protein L0Z50_37755 [Verrucomicrobiales bacterium]|nr:hypothetical protein [Verrucomicrobiales bacterium]